MMPGGRGMMEQAAKQFLRSTWAEGISELIAAVERDLTASVEDLVAATDADVDLDVPDADQRAEQLREGVLAIVEGDLQDHYVREYVDCAKADRVAALASLDEDDWQDRRDGWIETYREKGVDDLTDAEIVERHLLRTYRLDPEAFDRLRRWPDEMETAAMRTVLVGNVEAAREAIDAVTAEVDDGA